MECICEILVGGVNYVKSNLSRSKISFRCNVMECICETLAGGGGWFLHTPFYIHMQARLDKSPSAKSSRMTKKAKF